MEKFQRKEKVYQGIILALVLVIIFGVAFFASELKGCTKEVVEKAQLTSITMDNFDELWNGEEVSVIYLAKDDCGYCQQQKPVLIDVMTEYDIVVNYLDVNTLDNDAANTLYEKYGSFQEENYGVDGIRTPTMLFVSGGKLLYQTLGVIDEAGLIEYFTNYGLIVTE